MKSRTVELLLMTRLPERGLVAVLQVRGAYNPTTKKPHEWPGACQLTCHASVEDDESPRDALWRDCRQELGADAKSQLFAMTSPLTEIAKVDTDEREVRTYGLLVPADFLMKIPGSGTAGFRYIARDEKIFPVTTFDKTSGVANLGITAMFPNEIEAVQTAFNTFYNVF